jgi:DNA-binding NarL/FixJ family response regulator
MHDTIISELTKPILSWVLAFPEIHITNNFSFNIHLSEIYHAPSVCWVHVNNDQSNLMVDTIDAVIKKAPLARVVILTNLPSQAECFAALGAGAVGYVHAYSAPEVLHEVREVVMHGGIWLGSELLQKLIETTTKLTSNKSIYVDNLLSKLTAREKDVAIEVAKGRSNKEVARTLNITERTVKAHLAAIFDRLGAKDRMQLALMLNKG